MRIDARALLAAWRAAVQGGIDPFSTTAPDSLPSLPGWSALGLPERDLASGRSVTILDALRALSLRDREEGRTKDRVQVAATLPMRVPGVLPTKDAVREVVAAARDELVIVGYSITDNGLRDVLVDRAKDGVAVTVVGDRKNRAARDLRRSWPHGVRLVALEDVEGDIDNSSLHAKIVVADRKTAVLGSANFTVAGMTRNLELGARIEGAAAAQLATIVDTLRVNGWLVEIA